MNVKIKSLAYANLLAPPRKIDHLPDNVIVEVCQYGYPNLPINSLANTAIKTCINEWHQRCNLLDHYDYILLNENKLSFVMPLPMVTSIVANAQYLYGFQALNGGTQADQSSLPYSPWNHYAYPRLLWNIQLTASELLEEFFSGYFHETKQPMLDYYQTLENHLIQNKISIHIEGTYQYGITPGAFSYSILVAMRRYLEQAENLATSWVVRERVAKIRTGFNWVLSDSVITNTYLDNASGFPQVPADGSLLYVNLQTIPIHKNYVQLYPISNTYPNGYWAFWAHGTLAADLRLNQSGSYLITITAKGVPYMNIDPVLNVYLDHYRAESTAISSTEYKEYTFRINDAPAGVYRLLLNYRNAAEGGRRNIFIKEIHIQKISPTTLNALIKLAGNLNWPTARNAILGLGSFKEVETIGILVKKLISIMIKTLVKGIGFVNLTYQEYNVLKTFSALGDVAVTPLRSMATYAPYYTNIPNTSYYQTGVSALRALGTISGFKSLLVLKNIIQNIKMPIAYRLSAIDVVVTRTDIEAINILIQALNDSNLRTYVAKILAGAWTDTSTKDVYLATWISHPERKNNPIIVAALKASLAAEKKQTNPNKEYVILLTSILATISQLNLLHIS